MKIVTIVGARPQFIKSAALSRALKSESGIQEVIIHTGQHFDPNMSDVFFRELEIPDPDCHLGIGSHAHGAQTGRMLEKLEVALLEQKPDWVLVYGDTNSTLAGALAAVKLHMPVVHVEAGLRSFNRAMPEEINRLVADHISALCLAPTTTAVDNLRREGIEESKIHFVGDVMYDVSLLYAAKAKIESRILEKLNIESKKFILATIHRAENTDHPEALAAIFEGFIELSETWPIVLPLHPRTRKAMAGTPQFERAQCSIRITEPIGFLDMVSLEKEAVLILTDSGGLQKEAFFHRTPCVTLREETEWLELLDTGWNRLCPPRKGAKHLARTARDAIGMMGQDINLYGDGHSAEAIVRLLQTRSTIV